MAKRKVSVADLADLPDALRNEIAPHVQQSTESLEAIGKALMSRRQEAQTARLSNLEEIWTKCERAYHGIDELNQHEFIGNRWAKPMSMDGPVDTRTRLQGQPNRNRATVFIRVTARYVDAATAKICEILLPDDDKAFSVEPTPVPDVIKASKDTRQVVDKMGQPVFRPRTAEEIAAQGQSAGAVTPPAAVPPSLPPAMAGGAVTGPPAPAPGAMPAPGGGGPLPGAVATPGAAAQPQPQIPQAPLTYADKAKEILDAEYEKAKSAETRIYDWMVEGDYNAHMRKVIADSARLGVGVLKGPFPEKRSAMAVEGTGASLTIAMEEKIVPTQEWVDPWDFFPDANCGENVHAGQYVWQRSRIGEKKIRDLREMPGYIASQIDKVLGEGPGKQRTRENENPLTEQPTAGAPERQPYEIWYYYGAMSRSEMDCVCKAAGESLSKYGVDQSKQQVFAIVTMINDEVVRATVNPLDSGKFPYRVMPWSYRAGSWAGIGIAEQVDAPQRMVNQATRAMLNNAAKAAGTQIVVNRKAIRPADGVWEIVPDKIWLAEGDAEINDVKRAFELYTIPNTTDQLMKIVNLGLQYAEESTSIPLITQGQSGSTTPDTVGVAQLQNNNANQLLRSVGYRVDDCVTEPLVQDYYEYLLLDPDIPPEEKGDFQIKARGSSALVERAIQDQTIGQMAGMAKDPAYGLDAEKWAEYFLRTKRIAPKDLQLSDADKAKRDATPPPPAPAVQVAQINAQTKTAAIQSAEKIAAGVQETKQTALRVEAGVEAQRNDIQKESVALDHQAILQELAMKERLAIMDYSLKHNQTIEQTKAQLAITGMKLTTQKQLSEIDARREDGRAARNAYQKKIGPLRKPRPQRLPQAITPPTEPAGRAPPGQGFEA